jgi:Rps23 Pro-64 3,4-dihydroxylase Tpa1-like proline 4-hydroxylase
MPEMDETRAEKIMRAMLRKRFLDGFPEQPDTLIDFRQILDTFQSRAGEYQAASPFPFIVLDDFLPADSFRKVHAELPTLEDPSVRWGNLTTKLDDGRPAQILKYHLDNYLHMKPLVRQLIAELNSGPFSFMLSQLTGIEGLISDTMLQGAGVHLVKPGGMLRVHADYRFHPNLHLDRRINLLLYMNPDWKEEYGGHLEIWTSDMRTRVHRVLPIANRCVIFNTGDDTYHGHPRPLSCPEGMARKSIALYYFTARPAPTEKERVYGTAWQDLPEEKG